MEVELRAGVFICYISVFIGKKVCAKIFMVDRHTVENGGYGTFPLGTTL